MKKINFTLKTISIILISFWQLSLNAQCLQMIDSDNDGICDELDTCPNSAYNIDANNDGSCLPATIVLNEILTANYGSITNLYDEDGDSPDFIELFNTTNSAIDLGNWMLMDGGEKWKIPSGINIAANGYLTIWASGKDKSINQLHTNFKLSSKGEYLGLYDDQGNLVFEVNYPNQYNRLSYGINTNGQFNYFDTPTFNNANGTGYLGKVASPTANIGRGFYETSVVETLTSNIPNATIRYTIDGTPVTSNSSLYTNGVTINPDSSGVVTLRAKAFLSNYANSDEISFSYVFPNYMFGGNFYEGVSELPVISIQTDDQTFPECEGYDLEKICDKEPMIIDWIEKDSLGNNKEGFSAYAGVNVFGESTTNTSKRNFRVHFDATYNQKYLEYPIFETYPQGDNAPADKFRKFELRGNQYENLNYGGETGLSEQWINSLRVELGELGPHSVYVNLFVNGSYRGLYVLRERFDHNFYESYTGVDAEDINALKADYRDPWNYITANGSTNTWETMVDNALNSNQSTYQSYKDLLDPNSILTQTAIESMINGYGEKEFRIVGSDINVAAPYRVIASDISDFFFNWEWDVGVPGYYDEDALLPFFYNWLEDPEFEQEVFEFTAKFFCGSGALTVDRSKDRMNEWKSIIAPVAASDFAFYYEDKNLSYTSTSIDNDIASWEYDVAYDLALLDDLADMHYAWDTAGLFQGCDLRPVVDTENQISEINEPTSYVVDAFDPDGDAMTFSVVSGLPSGLSINSSTGEISGTPTQLGTYEVKLKVEDSNNKWGYHYFTWKVINLNSQPGGQLVINEIHYNPLDSILSSGGRIDDDNFEFIEVKNIGTADVILQGKVFTKGVDLEIEEPLIVEPNGFAVFAKDSCWFEAKYGFFPDAVYKNKLDNGGEYLRLKSPYKEILDSLTYDDQYGWDTIPDGSQYSLALIDGNLDNALASSWSAQSVFTTPGAENLFCNSATVGTACDDDNVCTINDAYDASCNCVGTFQDSDSDGICDANDDCDAALNGTACDDGDVCTINDAYDASCNCVGTFQDSDSDGICDANDDCDASLNGTACDDGDVCTINDAYDANCNCVGTFQDSDGDGICDANDTGDTGCTNVTNSFPSNPLTHSGSGSNPTTLNLSGTHQDASFTISNINQKLNGPNHKKYIEQVTVTYVDGTGTTQTYGVYTGANTSSVNINIADEVQSITVSLTDVLDGNSGSSSMNISFTDVSSCEGGDSGTGGGCTTVGQSCNDGDFCTTGDVYDNNCNCVGIFQDSDGDGICDANDGGDTGGCTNTTFNFSSNPLTQSGSGSGSTTLNFPINATDVSFSVSNINRKISGKASRRYIEQVTITYVDAAGVPQTYGVYSGANTSSINISISQEIQSITISLEDIFDGSTQSTMSIDMSTVTACVEGAGFRLDDTNQNTNMMIVPNPTQDRIQVVFNSNYNLEAAIQLNAIDGSILEQKRLLATEGQNVVEFDLSHLPEGIYFAAIQIRGEITVKKVIKLK